MQLFNPDDHGTSRGIVYKRTKESYHVYADGRMILCALSSRLYRQTGHPKSKPCSARRAAGVHAFEHTDPVAVGDEVWFIEAQDGQGTIVDVLPRRNKLARRTAVPMPSARSFEQVIVANVDQIVPVFAAACPAPRWNLLDRYLVSAESANLPSLICINKSDLAQAQDDSAESELGEVVQDYQRVGYPVILVSAITGEGLDDLKQALKGRISVLVGKSGVGKTSLLNALQPGLGLRVDGVSRATGKGKHTTTCLEMFPLEFGGGVVDTPGIREFGLWDVNRDDLALLFPEMQPFVGQCKFGLDCQHDNEPGCAVRKAVMVGQISPRRYQSYMRLKQDA